MFLLRLVPLLFGLSVMVSTTLAIVVRPLDDADRINSFFLIATGALAAGWGARRTWRGRVLLSRPVVVRLDEEGVHLASGPVDDPRPVWLAWGDLEAVALLPAPGTYGGKPGTFTMLRFVARSDDCVHGFYGDPYTRHKAELVDVSTAQAAMTLIQGQSSAFRVPLILEWLERNQPDVRVVDNRMTS